MRNDKLLTIAVPAYNAAHCLHACLDSLVNGLSTAELAQLEILIVNDGSTDQGATQKLAEAFALEQPDGLVRVLLKPNGGHGSAINLAIREARGSYFKVVDADDWLCAGSLSLFLHTLSNCHADVILTAFDTVDAGSGHRTHFSFNNLETNKLYAFADLWALQPGARAVLNFHGICYRLDCLKAAKLNLPEYVSYEDHAYATVPFRFVESILPLDLTLYQYLIGQANQSVSTENKLKSLDSLEIVFTYIYDSYSSAEFPLAPLSESQRSYFLYQLAELLLDYYTVCLLKNPDRKAGRAQAAAMDTRLNALDPEIQALISSRYHRLRLLSRLGINADILDALKRSPLYHRLKRLMR